MEFERPNYMSTAHYIWEGPPHTFHPLVHLHPRDYKVFLYKWAQTVGIWRNGTQEPHGYGEWGAPHGHSYPLGPNLRIVGYEADPRSPFVFIMAEDRQGQRHGQIYKIWSRWLRLTSFRVDPRPHTGFNHPGEAHLPLPPALSWHGPSFAGAAFGPVRGP